MFEISVEIGIFAIKLSPFWFPFEFLALFGSFYSYFTFLNKKHYRKNTHKKDLWNFTETKNIAAKFQDKIFLPVHSHLLS